VKILKGAANARNYSQCDSMLLGDRCGAHTFPYIEVKNTTSQVEHEASTSKLSEDQLFYLRSRGIRQEDALQAIVSKGISAGQGQNTYRGLVKVLKGAENARNYSQCDSMLLGDKCGAHTFPYIEVKNPSAKVEHEASTSKIGEDQLFYLRQRGLSMEDAVGMIVNGFCKEVFRELPMEFAVEAQKLLGVSLEGSVG